MKKNASNLRYYLFSLGLLIIGLGIFYYTFELVSVTHVREYHEGWGVLIGLILAAAGVALGVYKIRKARRRPATSDTAAPPAG